MAKSATGGLFEGWFIRILNLPAIVSKGIRAHCTGDRLAREMLILDSNQPESKEEVMTHTKQVLWILALATVLVLPRLASAQTCASNSDCAQGLTCQVDTSTVTPTPACPAGISCPPPPPPTLSMICLPALCQSDADCGQAMVCHSTTTTICSGGTVVAVKCDPNTVCAPTPAPEPPVCTDTTASQCAYKWQLPCNADVDCGDGFLCQPTTIGMCSGSGSTGSGTATSSSGTGGGGGAGALPAPLPMPASDGGTTTTPVCTATTSYPGSCQAKATTCTTDADCPSIWKCLDLNVPTTVSSGPVAVDAGAAPTPMPPTTTSTATATATAVKTCQAPSAYPRGAGGNGTTQTTVAVGTSTNGGVTTKGTTTPPSTDLPGGVTSTDTHSTAQITGGGCALGAGELSTSPAMVIALFGALGLLRRRRRRGM
jgi:hypothetical protein